MNVMNKYYKKKKREILLQAVKYSCMAFISYIFRGIGILILILFV